MRDRVLGACIGTAIGDALGMPAEGKKPETITRLYNKIRTYRTPKSAKNGTPFHHNLKRGMWTDDTQLMLAIGESIVENKRIDYDDIADRHIDAYLERRGWGRTTKKAIENIMEGSDWYDAGVESAGNGPCMKIAPIGVMHGLGTINDFELICAVLNLSKMTHNDPRPAIAAFVQAKLVSAGIRMGVPGLKQQLSDFYDYYQGVDQLRYVFGDGDPSMCDALNSALYSSTRKRLSELRKELKTGSFVVESFPFTVAMINRYVDKPEKCIEVIVNWGGDADTTGAMAGAVLGAAYGYTNFPARWRKGLEQKARIAKMAIGLYELSKKVSKSEDANV